MKDDYVELPDGFRWRVQPDALFHPYPEVKLQKRHSFLGICWWETLNKRIQLPSDAEDWDFDVASLVEYAQRDMWTTYTNTRRLYEEWR